MQFDDGFRHQSKAYIFYLLELSDLYSNELPTCNHAYQFAYYFQFYCQISPEQKKLTTPTNSIGNMRFENNN